MSICFDLELVDLKTQQKINNVLCLVNTDFNLLAINKHQHLHTNELKYFDALPSLERQKSYLLGRISAKSAITKLHANILPADICINNGIFEFPYIEAPLGINLQISLSHSADLAVAVAFSQSHPMAIDIELINPDRMEVIKSQASEAELAIIFALFADHAVGLTLLWTAKEALSKVLKCGLLIDFKLLEINSILKVGEQFIVKYKNFTQYQTIAFECAGTICSLVYPVNTTLNLDTNIFKVTKEHNNGTIYAA